MTDTPPPLSEDARARLRYEADNGGKVRGRDLAALLARLDWAEGEVERLGEDEDELVDQTDRRTEDEAEWLR